MSIKILKLYVDKNRYFVVNCYTGLKMKVVLSGGQVEIFPKIFLRKSRYRRGPRWPLLRWQPRNLRLSPWKVHLWKYLVYPHFRWYLSDPGQRKNTAGPLPDRRKKEAWPLGLCGQVFKTTYFMDQFPNFLGEYARFGGLMISNEHHFHKGLKMRSPREYRKIANNLETCPVL